MITICPKCSYIRKPDATVPKWQCPACGIAYVKAGEAKLGNTRSTRRVQKVETTHATDFLKLLIKLFLLTAVLWGLWSGWQAALRTPHPNGSVTNPITTLASSVKASDVVIYTTTTCGPCKEAKNWLRSNGFAFTECNMTDSASCEQEFQSYGADGTPFLVIRYGGKQSYMKDGFDSQQFLALLQ